MGLCVIMTDRCFTSNTVLGFFTDLMGIKLKQSAKLTTTTTKQESGNGSIGL